MASPGPAAAAGDAPVTPATPRAAAPASPSAERRDRAVWVNNRSGRMVLLRTQGADRTRAGVTQATLVPAPTPAPQLNRTSPGLLNAHRTARRQQRLHGSHQRPDQEGESRRPDRPLRPTVRPSQITA